MSQTNSRAEQILSVTPWDTYPQACKVDDFGGQFDARRHRFLKDVVDVSNIAQVFVDMESASSTESPVVQAKAISSVYERGLCQR